MFFDSLSVLNIEANPSNILIMDKAKGINTSILVADLSIRKLTHKNIAIIENPANINPFRKHLNLLVLYLLKKFLIKSHLFILIKDLSSTSII
jgi:hypothetical protein